MSEAPSVCLKCRGENCYPDGDHMVCADCGHEWNPAEADAAAGEAAAPASDGVIRDANGAALATGDSVVLIKSLKVKGGATIKQGTKVTNIKLIDGDHEIDCRIDNVGMLLKAQYVRKV